MRLHADDRNTGRARSGVGQVRYQRDSGGWQTGGNDVTFPVSSDGPHNVDYYAVDIVGNEEQPHGNASFRIDQTPPGLPTNVRELHSVPNGAWQKNEKTPTFAWNPASDTPSGLQYEEFYFGPDANGQAVHARFAPSDARLWTPQSGGVRTGTYYLRARTRDVAGNWSTGEGGTAWNTFFTFRYDSTPPENPGRATHAAGIANDVWQRVTRTADFTWPTANDEGSGLKGYFVYWGTDSTGTGSTFMTASSYQSPTPLCAVDAICSGYLRLRSRDNVDNDANEWTTAFVLRYDNIPPTVDFTFNGGVTQTNQTQVVLNIAASDQGSGVREMRLSGDGQVWTPWEVYATERAWELPGISRQSWPVYLQVRDGVDLPSAVVSHTVYLDVNPQQPRSAGYRLFDHIQVAGVGVYSSTTYTGRGTLGQVADSPRITGTTHIILSGYEAGSQARPIAIPGHDEFTFINGIFASGTGADTLQSALYRMLGDLGEPGLPNNETTLASTGYQHQPGFLAAAPSAGTPTPTPRPGPTVTPTPTPPCEFPRISINNGALFTNDVNVTLNLCAPRMQEMMLSNDGGFGSAVWEPYAETKAWTLTTYGQYVIPRYIYAAFKDAAGRIYNTYMDDIIYDPNPPTGNVSVGDSLSTLQVGKLQVGRLKVENSNLQLSTLNLLTVQADGTVDLFINARDDNSGLAEMQISATGTFGETTWEPYLALKPWTPEGGDGVKTAYARFRDSAGNISSVANTSFALDTQAPFGGIALGYRVVGPKIITTTVYLGAEDNLSGVTDMRLSDDPAFTHAAWQPYTTTVTWPISLTSQTQGTVYVRYRDDVGNVSEVYSDTYTVDTTPPVMYVEVAPGSTLTRTVSVLAYDELSSVSTMCLSNDPRMIVGVVTLPYSQTVTWTFDDRRVVWVQLEDGVGNVTEPYPAYAGGACLEDLDANGQTDVGDLQRMAALWRQAATVPYDRDGDGRITMSDIMWYANRWGQPACQ